jgi:hypothetical protein
MNDKSCPTYQKKIKQLKLPKTKEEKIIYFLWLDDQLMELWADYLNMKCLYPFSDTRDEKESKQIEDKLLLIEHFEMYIDAVNLHITYREIEQWTRDNNYKKTFIFNRI